MLIVSNEYNIDFDSQLWENIANELTLKDIEIVIINDEEIQMINYEIRGINAPTDVISQPLTTMPHAPLGTLFIDYEYASRQALQWKHSLNDEMTLLFIHGLLHLLGYDHEKDDGLMRRKEEQIIYKYTLPQSLIVRSGE